VKAIRHEDHVDARRHQRGKVKCVARNELNVSNATLGKASARHIVQQGIDVDRENAARHLCNRESEPSIA
jgi:hypothetical protein